MSFLSEPIKMEIERFLKSDAGIQLVQLIRSFDPADGLISDELRKTPYAYAEAFGMLRAVDRIATLLETIQLEGFLVSRKPIEHVESSYGKESTLKELIRSGIIKEEGVQ